MNSSVIIPAFNAEKTIEKTIGSVLEQSLKPKEIIVVNDGSTDKTEKIVKRIAEKNPLVRLFSRNNSGISASRNFGALNASAEIIVFLDSDVSVEKKWLEKLVLPLKDKNVFACCGKYSVESNKSFSSDFFSFVVSSSSFQGYNIAFRKKDFLEFNGFNENMRFSEDPELFLRAVISGKKLVETNAESFHTSYSLSERIKSNYNYSFFDAVLFKKNFGFLANPLNLFKAPKNIKYIFGFYFMVFFSAILTILLFLASGNIFSVLFVFLPCLAGCIKIALNKNNALYCNNFVLVMFYSFFALFLFELVKGTGFVKGLLFG